VLEPHQKFATVAQIRPIVTNHLQNHRFLPPTVQHGRILPAGRVDQSAGGELLVPPARRGCNRAQRLVRQREARFPERLPETGRVLAEKVPIIDRYRLGQVVVGRPGTVGVLPGPAFGHDQLLLPRFGPADEPVAALCGEKRDFGGKSGLGRRLAQSGGRAVCVLCARRLRHCRRRACDDVCGRDSLKFAGEHGQKCAGAGYDMSGDKILKETPSENCFRLFWT